MNKKILIIFILNLSIFLNYFFTDAYEISKFSNNDNLALNEELKGFPSPLESSKGWGGGSFVWEIVDGIRTYKHWAHGLAFCGGINNWCGEKCGWRQVVINFGKEVTLNKIIVWHHGIEHVPNVYKVQYWDGNEFRTIFSTQNGRASVKFSNDPTRWWENFSIPVETTFKTVTTSKIRYLLNNCDIEHGWIYEFEVYGPKQNKYLVDVVEDIKEIPDFKSSPRPYDFAVIIGIENYQGLPKSDFSGNDAKLVKDYLKALGFQERNIEFITDEKATKSGIEKAIEAWLPNRVKKDSRVIVYYSGHGAPEPKTGEAYIVPYDGDPNYLEVTGYSVKRLYDRLGKLQAQEVVVLLDSCFSGAGGRSVLAKGARPLVMMTDMPILLQNMVVLTATKSNQISVSSPEKGHGVFTYYFLKALKEGKKTISDIYEYIKPLIEDEAKQLNAEQTPSITPEPEKIKGKFNLQ